MHHIAVEKHSSLAVYRGEALDLTRQGLRTEHFIDHDLTPEICEVVPCPELPGPWLPRAYKLVGGVLELTPEGKAALDAEAERAAQQEAEDLAQAARDAVPASVSRFQARAALAMAGYFDGIEARMSAPETPVVMRLAWQDATTFDRDSATVAALAGVLGLDSAALDALFVTAAGIRA